MFVEEGRLGSATYFFGRTGDEGAVGRCMNHTPL